MIKTARPVKTRTARQLKLAAANDRAALAEIDRMLAEQTALVEIERILAEGSVCLADLNGLVEMLPPDTFVFRLAEDCVGHFLHIAHGGQGNVFGSLESLRDELR